jgi:5-methylcytosine-specific restriction endonuclease McrA
MEYLYNGGMKKKIQLKPGVKINRLTIIRLDHVDSRFRAYYVFRCDCGTKKVIHGAAVISNNTKSCGCLNREIKAATALPGGLGAMRQVVLQNYKRGGKRRKWLITEGEFFRLSQQDCHYCGEPPSQTRKGAGRGHDFTYNGLDRVDTTKEYTTQNVVTCCKRCNVAKNDISVAEFKVWVKKIATMAEQWG